MNSVYVPTCVNVCLCPKGVWLWWDCSSAVSVGGRVCVSAVPCWPGAFQGETEIQSVITTPGGFLVHYIDFTVTK